MSLRTRQCRFKIFGAGCCGCFAWSASGLALVLFSVLLLQAIGCGIPVQHRNWEGYTGPGAQYFQAEETPAPEPQPDPLEPFNRCLSFVNDQLSIFVIKPLSRVYRLVVPGLVRTGIRNADANLGFPGHLVNNLLQGKVRGAREETLRFLLNTTLGLGGLLDPATRWGIQASPEDTGQTLARWGWKTSSYLVLPLLGPSTVRDGFGTAGDAALDPRTYLLAAPYSILTNGAVRLNEASDTIDTYVRFLQSEYDSYAESRDLWSIDRRRETVDHPLADVETPALETLRAMFLTFRDPQFPSRCDTHEALLSTTKRSIPYNVWMQPHPAPVVMILPGLAAHRESSASLALAEMVYRNGFSAVTVSGVLNWEFIENASSVDVCGYAPIDAGDAHVALDAINTDLERRYPGHGTSTVLMGFSLGAFHSLLIAATESESSLVQFDRYVAINPPVRLIYGMQQLDAYYNAPLEWGSDERQRRIQETLMKAIELGDGRLKPSGALPFTDIEARFLVGLAFRLALRDVIYATQSRHNLGILKTPLHSLRRESAYREIARYSYMEYLYAFILPYYVRRDAEITGVDFMIAQDDLRSWETGLRSARGRIRILTNRDDFLLSSADVDWLLRFFGSERVGVFAEGGHLGNLYKTEVQDRIMRSIEDLKSGVSAGGCGSREPTICRKARGSAEGISVH